MRINYVKVRENVKDPVRANPSDAGIDLFYCPDKISDHTSEIIRPDETKHLETGLKFEIPHGYVMRILDRSSMASKDVITTAGVIDSGYEGEVSVLLHNLNDGPYKVKEGDKIAQAVIQPIVTFPLREIDEEEYYEDTPTISDRGEDGFGSTGR